MTGQELLKLIAAQRKERCQEILANPAEYKICEGCSSLLYDFKGRDGHCPFCSAYRFEKNIDAIIELAKLLGDRELAVGCPILPRVTTPKGLTAA